MSTESESSEFIGWYSRNDEVEGLKARNAVLIENCARIAESTSPEDWSPEGMRKAIANAIRQQSTEKP